MASRCTFSNELARLCELVGTDVHQVARAMGLNQRIGAKFLHPGLRDGDSCLPKDVAALAQIAWDHRVELAITEAMLQTNGLRNTSKST